MRTEIETLSNYIASAVEIPLSDSILGKARQHTLDTIGAIVSGSQLRAGRAGIEYVASQQVANGRSSVCGSPLKATPSLAALANAMSAHADETDDSHEMALFHPGCGIVPAALAVAEVEDRTVEELLRAVAVGYDVGARIILAIGLENFMPLNSTFSTHAFANAFGAAAAAASLWRLQPNQVAWVLSYSAQQASGLSTWLRDRNHVEKAFVFGGMPARNGVAAAEMVRFGWDGVDDVFTGEPNFLDILSSKPDRSQLTDGLGERFEIARTNIKKFAVGSPAQAVLQALEDLMAQEPIDMAAVEEIRVLLPNEFIVVMDNRPMPDINIQYLVAASIADGYSGFAMAHDYQRVRRPEIREAMTRVKLLADLTMKPMSRQARVEIIFKDGRRRDKHTPVVRGTWQDPITDRELLAKVLDLIQPVLGKDNAAKLIRTIMDNSVFGRAADVGHLLGTKQLGDPKGQHL